MTGYDRDNTNLNYEDIINLPHPVSKRHKPMPVGDRAAQFSPFAKKNVIANRHRLTVGQSVSFRNTGCRASLISEIAVYFPVYSW